jgi:hypothetical protein
MDHQSASELFSGFIEGELAGAAKDDLEQHLSLCIQCRTDLEEFRRAVAGLGRLKRPAPSMFLPQIQKQIYVRSQGRFFGGRWKLFGRIPFEWVSLAMIIAMLVYYIVQLRGAPTGVKPIGALVPRPGVTKFLTNDASFCCDAKAPSEHIREDHLEILALREPGRQGVIGSSAARVDDAHAPAGVLGARGDDALELDGVDVLRA